MRKKKLKLVNLFRFVLVCALTLLMVVKPVINIVFYGEDTKQEFVELQGNEDSQKEIFEVDDENKEPKLFTSYLMNQNRLKKRTHSFFNFRNGTINYDPDIPIPPPRNFNRIEWL